MGVQQEFSMKNPYLSLFSVSRFMWMHKISEKISELVLTKTDYKHMDITKSMNSVERGPIS